MKLDYYVFGEVLGPFVGGVIFFCFIFLMFQVLRLSDLFIIHGASGATLSKMTALMIVTVLPFVLPIAFLIAVLVSFGRLSSDCELIAMKASGISLLRLSIPVCSLAMVVSILSLGLNLSWVPWAERAFKSTLIKVSNTKVVTSIHEGTFNAGFFDLLLYAEKVDPATNRLEGVFIYDEREAKNPMTIVARRGEILPIRSDTALGAAVMLKLYNGNTHSSSAGERNYQKIDFDVKRLYLKIDEGADTSTMKPRMVPYNDLLSSLKATGLPLELTRELYAEYWRRYAVALSPIIFVFLGIGFGTIRTRAVRASAALVAAIVLLVFYGLQSFGTIAAQKGYIPPVVAMMLPNFISAIAAYFGFRSATW